MTITDQLTELKGPTDRLNNAQDFLRWNSLGLKIRLHPLRYTKNIPPFPASN
jgi:hypothetical protein